MPAQSNLELMEIAIMIGFQSDADGRLRAYTEPAKLSKAVECFRSGERRGIPSMWMLVNVEMWLRSLSASRDGPETLANMASPSLADMRA